MSKFDERLEKELAKLEEQKKKKKKTTDIVKDRLSYLPSSDDDIGPVHSGGGGKIEPKTGNKDLFGLDLVQKGAFNDGYDFGDITKTILGTAGDIVLGGVKGAANTVGGIVDLAQYGVAGAADLLGADDFAKKQRQWANKDVVNSATKDAEEWLDDYSILGNTTTAITEGLGQVGTTILTGGLGKAAGLGNVGVTALTSGSMFASGMGSGMSEAYNAGATDSEALTYGTISGAADALSEMLFGGLGKGLNATGFNKGLLNADDLLAKKVSGLFKKQLTKNLAEYGIKAGAEGFEEVIAGIAQAGGKKLTYMSEEDFSKILEDENLLEQFVVGSVVSGIAQAKGVKVANDTKTDFVTGRTQNEQLVIEKEVENRIAEMEADGKKLTGREKATVEAQVEKDLEKGYISTDTIEEVLGGTDYMQWKNDSDVADNMQQEYDDLSREYDELYSMKNSDKSNKQIDREAELKDSILPQRKSRLDEFNSKSNLSQVRERISQRVYETAKNDRLVESYNEKARRTQTYEADLSKYDEKQKAVIQKAIDSGVLNNTNRTHAFVDMVAKISADKGVLFDFTTNQKLRESGFAMEGVTQNGFVNKNGDITVNLNAAESLNYVVGHEITHVLEGTEMYSELQKAVEQYARGKGEYDSRLKSLTELYAKHDPNADPVKELTADLVGKYLFTDQDFINNLSTNHRNVFQKVYDEIKYLLKVATAGSKEARQLEKAKRAFEKAYRADSKTDTNAETDVETKFSLREEAPPKNTGVAYKVFFVKDGKLYPPMVANPDGADTPMGVWLNADMGTAAPPSKTGRAQVKAGGKGTQGGSGSLAFRPGWHLGDLPRASQFDRVNPETGKKELFPENFVWAEVEYAKDVDYQEEAMSYGYTDNGKFRHAYAGLPRLPKNGYYRYRTNPKPDTVPWVITGAMKVNRLLSDAEVNAILEKNGVPPVHRQGGDVGLDKFGFNDDGTVKYSLSDSNGKQLSQEQQDYFKDSVVRDENGNLKVMYHGTSRGGFNSFDTYGSNYGLFGTGSYFTDNADIGQSYTKKGKGTKPQVYETYLNIKNPLDMDAEAKPAEWVEEFPDVDFPESGTNEQFYRALEEYFEDQMMPKWEVADIIRESIQFGMGYDGLTHIGGGRVNADGVRHQVYIAFEPEQIKNTNNIKPTDNIDIRYSLSEDSDGNRLTEEQERYFRSSKMRDENGNLKPMYHGSRNGGFHVFDPSYSDDDISLFFVDRNDVAMSYSGTSETYEAKTIRTAEDMNNLLAEIGYDHYEAIEKDGKFELLEDGDHVATSDTAQGIYKEFCWYEGIGEGDVNYKVYLNLVNPLEVNARGAEWSEVKIPKEHLADFNETIYQNPDPYGYISTATTRDFAEYAKLQGHDGVIFTNIRDNGGFSNGSEGASNVAIAFDSNQVKSVANTQPTSDPDIRYSLSEQPDQVRTHSRNQTYGSDIALPSALEEISPTVAKKETVGTVSERDIIGTPATEEEVSAMGSEMLQYASDTDAPPEFDAPYFEDNQTEVEDPFEDRDWFEVAKDCKTHAYMYENPEVKPFFQEEAQKLLDEFNGTIRGERFWTEEGGYSGVSRMTSKSMETLLDDWNMRYDDIERGLNAIIKDNGAENIAAAKKIEFMLNDRLLNGYWDFWTGKQIPPNQEYIQALEEKQITEYHQEAFERLMANPDQFAPYEEDPAEVTEEIKETSETEDIAPLYDAIPKNGRNSVLEGQQSMVKEEEAKKLTRKELHKTIIDRLKSVFTKKGYNLDHVLKHAKDLSTFATVDNTPQRVMNKSLGYKAGEILADETVNKVAQNESEGIKWLNKYTDRKNGILAQISRQYKIKPGSKESAAAQMYAEGFWVNQVNDIVKYGDAELFRDFRDPDVRRRIKGLANDPRIRQIYDETLNAINESRTRNAYPEIPRLKNYFLHFRAMNDTFSRLGLPFNPNDIRAKDLPTDLNGVTADLKPGQPFFASAMHRKGIRTSFDLLGGLEKYLTSAKNQIYHIDDIQTLRALRNYIADTWGQAHGLESLDDLSEEETQERIKEVYDSHLSTFAKFLNEEANILAGKTSLIDRGIEGIIGRRGMTFFDNVNRQVGANMVGYNVSSSLTNFLAPVQAFAKMNKSSFVKGFAQTVSNRFASIAGKGDGFAEQSPVMIRRQGADRFHRTFWQKISDPGYALMGAVDSISTEIIARAKYNELTKKGMDSQKAHFETDKWVSRLMGDRSLGQQPQIFNSKMLGLVTKFQLEVRNQLDSQFYDTIQEAKVSNEHIQNGLARNAKTAAKITSTLVELAVVQHLFGKAFESIAGYNPAFDIISAIATAFGWDDEEDSEDTAFDNIEQGLNEFLEDMPYASVLMDGGRIPISSALPIGEFIKGEDQYGNEKSRWKIAGETVPYYLLPGGYGQIKKTAAGLGMFSDEHPIAGSYTNSGNLRFPVEDTVGNRVQAAIFGQYASENARDYFDNERSALKPKQTQELIDVGMSIQDYWQYRDGLKAFDDLEEKMDYINSLDLTTAQKNILVNNIADRKEAIDISDYDDYSSLEEFDYANKNPEKYAFFDKLGIDYNTYKNADEDAKKAYDWAYENPEKYSLSKAIAGDVVKYRSYTDALNDIKADKDSSGKSISGSRKEKVANYINSLDMDYGEKIILFKSEYEADDTYNEEIIDYLNNRSDITYAEMVEILKQLGFTVTNDGNVYWD